MNKTCFGLIEIIAGKRGRRGFSPTVIVWTFNGEGGKRGKIMRRCPALREMIKLVRHVNAEHARAWARGRARKRTWRPTQRGAVKFDVRAYQAEKLIREIGESNE